VAVEHLVDLDFVLRNLLLQKMKVLLSTEGRGSRRCGSRQATTEIPLARDDRYPPQKELQTHKALKSQDVSPEQPILRESHAS